MQKFIKACPFCGEIPSVVQETSDFTMVRCDTVSCPQWTVTQELEDWNTRTGLQKLAQYLYDVTPEYVTGKFKPVNIYTCRCCKKSARSTKKVRHTKKCFVGNIL